MNYRNLAAKIGAVFYVLWGIYHLPAAPGLTGPLLWIVAFGFTTVGRFGLGSSAAARAGI